MNNPLMFTDPTGFSWWTNFRDKVIRPAAAIAAAYFVGPWVTNAFFSAAASAAGAGLTSAQVAGMWSTAQIVGGAAGGFAAGLVGSGGDLRAGAIGAISGGMFGWAGGVGEATSAGRYAAHAAAGCVSGELGGGGCARGAASALVGKAVTNATADSGKVSRGIAATVAGGTMSVIGGGKFANGATTAAFGYMFNELLSQGDPRTAMRRSGYSERGANWLAVGELDVPFYPRASAEQLNNLADNLAAVGEYLAYATAASLAMPGGQIVAPVLGGFGILATTLEQAARPNMTGLFIDKTIDFIVPGVGSVFHVPKSITIPIAEGIKKSPQVECRKTGNGC